MKRSVLFLLMQFCCFLVEAQNKVEPVTINVDLTQRSGSKPAPIWRFFGYDEANYTYMKDGKKLLSELAALSPVPVFVRTHNLLTSGDGKPALKWSSTNAYTEDREGRPIYNWRITDSIFDTYIHLKMKPLVEVGFMPEVLSTTPEADGVQTTPDGKKVKHYTGWNYPPKDYKKFADLVYAWVKHCISRYGQNEVKTWYWEIWNEPDISYWKGTTEEYCKLYDYSADAIKRALPEAKVGGPETTNPGSAKAAAFLKTFLNHVVNEPSFATGKKDIPLEFITFHAKGDPKLIDKTVWMNMGVQLRNIEKGFQIIAGYPSLKHLPVIIGESDPEGCAACSEDFFPQNAYRNGTMYASYTAASFPRLYDLAARYDINLFGAVTWAFEFEDQPWFRGFRDLATNGVDKPVLNVFRMLGMMRGEQVKLTSTSPYNYQSICDSSVRRAEPDVNGFATSDGRVTYVLIWNYHDKNDVDTKATQVTISIKGLNSKRTQYRRMLIDQEHSNSFIAWKKMDSPANPNSAQYRQLEIAGKLQATGPVKTVAVKNNELKLEFELERQGVTLIELKSDTK